MTTDDEPDKDEEGTQEPGKDPEPEPTSPEGDSESEKDGKDKAEEDLKSSATDQQNARRMARDNQDRADAVSALLGGTTQATNVFVGSTIGFVEAGVHGQAGRGGSVASGPVTDETLRMVQETFVKPPDYPRILGGLRERSVILLRAEPGWGRTTTALHLLHTECLEGVEKLNPDVSLRVPRDLGLRSGRGHLLQWLKSDEAPQLHEFHLEQLKRALDKIGARLVVLLDPTTPVRDHALSDYVVDSGPPPDSGMVIGSHFTSHLAAAGKPGQEAADFPEFTELIAEVARAARRVGHLAEFARDLGEVVLERIDLTVVHDRYADSAKAAFREWFDGLADNDQRAFAVALAVFNGMPMHTVASTARSLAKSMQAAENPDRRTRTRSIFAMRRSDLIEQVGGEVSTASEETDLGPLAAHVVRYRDDRRPRKVLEHVWWEYDEAHVVVRQWLYKLGTSGDSRICARAGVASGLLSLSEFDHARQLVIERWADEIPHLYELAAVLGALELPSREPELQPLLVKMLDEWLEPRSTMGRKVAAVHALGTLGVVSPGRALRRMRRAAVREDSSNVRVAIASAVANLAMAPGRLGQVLVTLLKWSDDLRVNVRQTAMLCALWLSRHLTVSTTDTAERWPAMLYFAEHDPDVPQPLRYREQELGCRRVVVLALGRVLSGPLYIRSMYEVLKDWVATAQKDPAQRRPLGRLLADLEVETNDRKSLRFYLAEWATGRKNSAEAVEEILAVLDEEGERNE